MSTPIKLVIAHPLQPWIHRFTFKREHAKYAFVDAAQWFVTDEAFQGFHAEGEFSQGQGPFCAEAAGAEALQVFESGVFRAVDDSEVFAAAAFYGGLNEATPAFCHKVERLDDNALTTSASCGMVTFI